MEMLVSIHIKRTYLMISLIKPTWFGIRYFFCITGYFCSIFVFKVQPQRFRSPDHQDFYYLKIAYFLNISKSLYCNLNKNDRFLKI